MCDAFPFRTSLRVGTAACVLLLASSLAALAQQFTLADITVAPRIGDQPLPLTFASSALSGVSVDGTMRGVSFSTAGAEPWTLSLGKLEQGSATPALSSEARGILALAVSFEPDQKLSLAPRVIVPVGARHSAHAGVGTAIRAKVSRHVSFLGDLGTNDTAAAGWTPLAAAGVIGQWTRTQVETNVLRGGPSLTTQGALLLGSLDRELARGHVRPVAGLTISGLASRSRPTATATPTGETTTGSVGIVYDRLPRGQIAATSERELSASQDLNIRRVEWQAAAGGLGLRYTHKRHAHLSAADTGHSSRQVELDIPGWPGRDAGGRVDLRTVFTADPSAAGLGLRSHLKGRVDVFGDLGLAGETELALTGSDTRQRLRTLRLTSELPLPHGAAVQLLCTHRAGVRFSLAQSMEARISRTVQLIKR